MGEEKITSRKNRLIQQARSVRDGRERDLVFIEGVRLCEEALRAGIQIDSVFYVTGLEANERGALLLEELRSRHPRILNVSESVLESISDTKSPQGIVLLARRPSAGADILEVAGGAPLIVIMHRANNPANAGAMLRVAEAAGATAVISTQGSTDLLSPKSLRGSMGSAFRMPLWTGSTFEDALGWCRGRGIRTVATDASAANVHTGIDWKTPRAVIVGPEAGGLTIEEANSADDLVRIPMRPPVESLNVAVALAVVLYEAGRQRIECERKKL